MKNITSSLCGLSSSLFLNIGLSNLAQKFDAVSRGRQELCAHAHGASLTTICGFPAKRSN